MSVDVLIIYSDPDNEAIGGTDSGWVSQFKRFLELMLTQILGQKPNVMLADNNVSTAPAASTLVAILSQHFIKSNNCVEQANSFLHGRSQSDRSNLFKVFKNALNVTEQPASIRDLIGYEMYQLDPTSGVIREYTDYFSTEAERQYWMKMVDLAYDISNCLQLDKKPRSEATQKLHGRTIYLAETGHDLSVQRAIIKRELQRHGYSVLPDHTLPGNMNELEKSITNDLEESNFAIHLIGSAYGDIPSGTDKSIVEIQNELAAQKSQRAKVDNFDFSRLIWIVPNPSQASEKQKTFIDSVKRNADALEGAEILQTPLEDFKKIMREHLTEQGYKRKTSSINRFVYLIHDRLDQVQALPYVHVIEQAGFDILTPKFEGQLLDVREKHIENLSQLDVAVIFISKVNEQWVRMKLLDLLKAPGFGRTKPILGKALILAPGATVNVDTLKYEDLNIIRGSESESLESLRTWLKQFVVNE